MKSFLIRNMPAFVHQALKIQAAEKGVSLQDLCIKVLSDAADKGKNGKKEKAA